MTSKIFPLCFLIFNLSVVWPSLALAETDVPKETAESQSAKLPAVEVKLTVADRLKNVLITIDQREQAIAASKKLAEKETDDVAIEQFQQQIKNDEDIIRGLKSQFINVATDGADIYRERKKVDEKINWQDDLVAIFKPLIAQLKEISERPKVIESLEQDIAYWSKRELELNRAVIAITSKSKDIKDKGVRSHLKEILNTAQSRAESANQKLQLLHIQLETVKSDDNPFWDNISELLLSFASSMLYYLMIAFGLAYIGYQFVALLARIPKLMVDKRRPKRYVFVERTINLIKTVLGFFVATVIYLTVLYASGQWVLLVISLFILAGLILTMKNLIPKYFVEIRTLLNLGSIRQGERIIFDGLVWRINLIDIYTHLHNPALDAHLRVPIAKLVDASSRPQHKDEAWFPCSAGDFVILDDGLFGAVKQQTADIVEVELGGSIYTYPTRQFLDRRPRNLSKGFNTFEVFGFDYTHQAIATTTMLETYKRHINHVLKEHPLVGPYCTNIVVEFEKAAASSLDFKVIASFDGRAAENFYRIRRIIQTASVDIANQENWIIPFQQITLHGPENITE